MGDEGCLRDSHSVIVSVSLHVPIPSSISIVFIDPSDINYCDNHRGVFVKE